MILRLKRDASLDPQLRLVIDGILDKEVKEFPGTPGPTVTSGIFQKSSVIVPAKKGRKKHFVASSTDTAATVTLDDQVENRGPQFRRKRWSDEELALLDQAYQAHGLDILQIQTDAAYAELLARHTVTEVETKLARMSHHTPRATPTPLLVQIPQPILAPEVTEAPTPVEIAETSGVEMSTSASEPAMSNRSHDQENKSEDKKPKKRKRSELDSLLD